MCQKLLFSSDFFAYFKWWTILVHVHAILLVSITLLVIECYLGRPSCIRCCKYRVYHKKMALGEYTGCHKKWVPIMEKSQIGGIKGLCQWNGTNFKPEQILTRPKGRGTGSGSWRQNKAKRGTGCNMMLVVTATVWFRMWVFKGQLIVFETS